MLKRKLGLPLLLEVNAPLAEERGRLRRAWPAPARTLGRKSGLASADFVLPVTQVLAGHVAAVGVPAERIVVIPNGINRAHFAAAPTPEIAKRNLGLSGALVLGFTGFVRDWHGVDRVIRWMATSDAPANAILMVVGDGPVRVDLERLAAKLSLQGRVRFTGVIDRDRVPEHVAAFDIALQPAVVAYASPLKLFEYLALGKAVIAPRQPNIEEILCDGENAVLFDGQKKGDIEQSADPFVRGSSSAYQTVRRSDCHHRSAGSDLAWQCAAGRWSGSIESVREHSIVASNSAPRDRPAQERCHVLHVVPTLGAGGMELALARVINGLIPRGITHSIAVLKGDAIIRDRIDPSVKIHCIHAQARDPFVVMRLRSLIRQESPTAIHARNLWAWPEIALARLTMWPILPLVFSFHGLAEARALSHRWQIISRMLAG